MAAVTADHLPENKIEWANRMRQQFSPKDMCHPDGSINQEFFKPKKIIIQLTEDRKWGQPEREALYRGLEKHGVGKWREMITEYPELRRYDEQFIRIKASRLLGTQSLARHVGWKGNRVAVDAEREKHRVLGERLGCWKGGVLVEDDRGSVAKALSEQEVSADAVAQQH
jgi:hypothetical protein